MKLSLHAIRNTLYASRFTPSPLYICRDASTNQLLFMQNKPNLVHHRRIANSVYTMDYENKWPWRVRKNKPNSNPIKPNLQKAQMNVTSLITKDYRKNDAFAVRKNKPNSNPISSKAKMTANAFSQKDYENETAFRPRKNKPNQSQGIGNESKSPISPKLTNCPIYQRSYLYYATADLTVLYDFIFVL